MELTNRPLLAIANLDNNTIVVYDINEAEVKYTFAYHKAPIVGIAYNAIHDYVISLDKDGSFQYWCPLDGRNPKEYYQFKYQFATDLVTFRKNHVIPLSFALSRSGQWMGIFGNDWKVC